MSQTYRYLPDTAQDQAEMLAALNIGSVEELFENIPAAIRLQGELNIPKVVSEPDLMKKMYGLASKNKNANPLALALLGF